MKVEFTRLAESDLEAIGDYIAERSPLAAIGLIQELRRRCEGVADFPNAGPPRPQWGTDVRIIVYGKYLIVYRTRETVQILRIVHGARDLDALFDEEPIEE